MSKKKIIEAVLLSLTIAYAVTKAIANFQCNVSANHPHNSPPEKKHGKISSEGS